MKRKRSKRGKKENLVVSKNGTEYYSYSLNWRQDKPISTDQFAWDCPDTFV